MSDETINKLIEQLPAILIALTGLVTAVIAIFKSRTATSTANEAKAEASAVKTELRKM